MNCFKSNRWHSAKFAVAVFITCAVFSGRVAPLSANDQPITATNGSLRISAVDSDGRPIPNAKVQVSIWTNEKAFRSNRHYDCDERGKSTIQLPATVQIVRVWVRSPGYAPMFGQLWPQARVDGQPLPEEFTYKLTKGTVMGGLVKDDDGQPIEGARVEVRYASGGDDFGAPPPTGFDAWLASGDAARVTDAHGRWSLDNVPHGKRVEVRLKFTHSDYVNDTDWGGLQNDQSVTTEQLREQTAKIVMHRGCVVQGRVTDADDKPVKNAVVTWGDQPYWDDDSPQVRSDENGNYLFPPQGRGRSRLTIAAKGWMPQTRHIEVGPGLANQDFKLQPGKKLRIKFVDAAGKPVPKIAVQISQWRGAESLYSYKSSTRVDLQIPNLADDEGVYEWSWAPDDAVKYTFRHEEYANMEANIAADDRDHTQTLYPIFRIAGSVSDATTGKPIEHFRVVPVIHFRPDFPFLERSDAKDGKAGHFEMEFERTDIEHGVQIEAPGYVTFRTDRRYKVGDPNPTIDVRLQPAEPYIGRVLGPDGRPRGGTRVFVATNFQHLDLYELEDRDGDDSNNYVVMTDTNGAFEIVPQRDRYALFAISPSGYADAHRDAKEPPGELHLRAWASVEGRVLQNGEPMPNREVELWPIAFVGGDQPRADLRFSAKSDSDGSFLFERVPPIFCRVTPDLHFSVESPLKSSRSMPLHIAPGSKTSVDLGGGGAELTGRLVVDPPREPFDYHFSLTYLVAKRPGIDPPPFLAEKGFDWRDGWSDSWFQSQEGRAYLNTLHNWFVKPDPDGSFRISGVPPGEYELAVNLYGTTEGCLVHPVAQRVVPVEVAGDKSAIDMGKVVIPTHEVPQVGDMAANFEFQSPDGRSTDLAAQRGKFVLVDFWATWCGPCVAKLPEVDALRRDFAGDHELVVVGANLDSEPNAAREFLTKNPLAWHHALLGDWSNTEVPKRYGISSVPAYVLIDSQGRIVAIEYSMDKIRELLISVD